MNNSEYLNRSEAVDISMRHDLIHFYYESLLQAKFICAEQSHDQPPIDTIGGARKFVESGSRHDEQLLHYDCERALQEALRKNSWEIFQPLEHTFDDQSGKFIAFGQPVSDMLEVGLRVNLPEFERERREIEFAEEQLLNHLAARGEVDLSVVTFSLCPEDKSASEHGYVTELDKMMIRKAYLQRGPNGVITKSLEQVSMAGYSRTTIEQYFESVGIELPKNWKASDVLARHLMFNGQKDLVGVVEQLDKIEGKHLVMNQETSLDYSELRAESLRRKSLVENAVGYLKEFSIELAEQGYDYQSANKLFYQEMTDLIHAICAAQPEYSAAAFDHATGQLYSLAEVLENAGNGSEAQSIREQAKEFAPEISFCGMGGSANQQSDLSPGSGESKSARCLELTRCPLCSDLNYDGSKRSGKPKVNVFAEMTKNHIKCTRCDAKLDKRTGKFVSQGRIATKSK